MKIRVHFNDVIALQKFSTAINDCNCDVNLYDNHKCLDAKSIVALMNLDLGKQFMVEVITDNADELSKAMGVISEYEV